MASRPVEKKTNKKTKNKRALPTRFAEAVRKGDVDSPFTTRDLINWVKKYDIRQDDGSEYSPISQSSALSNATIKENKTFNKNAKFLFSKKNNQGVSIYWIAGN